MAHANKCALELELPPVSESVLESWISRKFFEGAQARGVRRGVNPNWTYPDNVIETIEAILAFQSLGATRTAQIIICLWAFGKEFSHRRVRIALKSELRRIVNRQQRGPSWWRHHFADVANVSEEERAKRLGQLPMLDTDLAAAGLVLPPELVFEFCLRAYWGTEVEKVDLSAQNPEASPPLPQTTVQLSIDGALGPPEESASGGYEALNLVCASDLEEARALFLIFAIALVLAKMFFDAFPNLTDSKLAIASAKAAKSFLTPEWIVPTVALFAILAFNARQKMAGLAAK